MSISTKIGDKGMTRLMYNVEVPKTDLRVEAYGTVDELSAALGMARALSAGDPFIDDLLRAVQKQLVVVMGELATRPQDMERYLKDGFQVVSPEMIAFLDKLVSELEQQRPKPVSREWALPGSDPASAALHVARTVARRAERRVCELNQNKELPNVEVIRYLNRLSDALWLLAGRLEKTSTK